MAKQRPALAAHPSFPFPSFLTVSRLITVCLLPLAVAPTRAVLQSNKTTLLLPAECQSSKVVPHEFAPRLTLQVQPLTFSPSLFPSNGVCLPSLLCVWPPGTVDSNKTRTHAQERRWVEWEMAAYTTPRNILAPTSFNSNRVPPLLLSFVPFPTDIQQNQPFKIPHFFSQPPGPVTFLYLPHVAITQLGSKFSFSSLSPSLFFLYFSSPSFSSLVGLRRSGLLLFTCVLLSFSRIHSLTLTLFVFLPVFFALTLCY
uniref:T. congolense-specific, cell surface-expressed gene family n=1 Tax=Trypanosoma congolense (strain IL3000) TaxID=1068625 RepID=G0URB5_TRYCI|nr:hypothetical protein TCIL3000_8_1440 [Trypanosoma congolense IL3000]